MVHGCTNFEWSTNCTFVRRSHEVGFPWRLTSDIQFGLCLFPVNNTWSWKRTETESFWRFIFLEKCCWTEEDGGVATIHRVGDKNMKKMCTAAIVGPQWQGIHISQWFSLPTLSKLIILSDSYVHNCPSVISKHSPLFIIHILLHSLYPLTLFLFVLQ